MIFEDTFPLRLYINLAYREDRRADLEMEFFTHGFVAERFPAIDRRWLKARTFPSPVALSGKVELKPGLAATALSLRMALREAERRQAMQVLLFEDDVAFAPNFAASFSQLVLPADWGILLLGCRHLEPPIPVTDGLVRCTAARDSHAIAIRQEHYRTVRKILGCAKNRKLIWGNGIAGVFDQIQSAIPTYAAYPNLVWQRSGYSNAQSKEVANYDENGEELRDLESRTIC